jgi:putative tryptophan/tyrosine transport system substrate-binding protein
MAWPESDPEAQSEVASFVQELQKLGWTEGRDLRIDTRWWIPTDQDSTHRFAKELVSLRPDVILSQGTSTTAALLRETRTIPIHDASELETVIAAQARKPNRGLFVLPDPFTNAYRVEITSLAARYRLPAVYAFRSFAELGGLLSYGNDLNDNFRRAAIYADRILKGDKPGELPVQAPVKFELVINLKTAKALGLDVPLFLQQLADEVIE